MNGDVKSFFHWPINQHSQRLEGVIHVTHSRHPAPCGTGALPLAFSIGVETAALAFPHVDECITGVSVSIVERQGLEARSMACCNASAVAAPGITVVFSVWAPATGITTRAGVPLNPNA